MLVRDGETCLLREGAEGKPVGCGDVVEGGEDGGEAPAAEGGEAAGVAGGRSGAIVRNGARQRRRRP